MSDASNTARVSKLNAEIEKLSERIEGVQCEAEATTADESQSGSAKKAIQRQRLVCAKIRGGMVQEREEILEKRRVEDVIREMEELGWTPNYAATFEDCPICLDQLPVSLALNAMLACCEKIICRPCHESMCKHIALGSSATCPMCREDLPRNDEEMNERYRSQAENGKAWAQQKVGDAFEEAGDLQSAVHWFRLAAEQGYAPAQCNLGRCYRLGLGGLPMCDVEAKKHGLASAKQGLPEAQCMLGSIIALPQEESQGSEDLIEAVRLFTLSAAQGSDPASWVLGRMHARGSGGLEKSSERALYWFMKGAKNGDEKAQYEVGGVMLEIAKEQYDASIDITGFSVVPRAAFWYRNAADQGHIEAKRMLGRLEREAKSRCSGCLEPFTSDAAPKNCARCKCVFYCSVECQLEHWRKGHKVECLDKDMLK